MKVKMQDGGLLLIAENVAEATSLAKLTSDHHAHSLNIDGMNHSVTDVQVNDEEEKRKLDEQNAKTQANAWREQFKMKTREQSLSGGFTPGGGGGLPATTGNQTGTPGVITTGAGAAAEGVYDRNARPASAGTTEVGGVTSPSGVGSGVTRSPLGETASSPTALNPESGTTVGSAPVNNSAGPNAADLDINKTGQDTSVQSGTGIGSQATKPGGEVPNAFQKKQFLFLQDIERFFSRRTIKPALLKAGFFLLLNFF